MPTSRTFIAISIPIEVQRTLGQLQEFLKEELPSVRWTKVEGIHLTLKFLGEVENNILGSIEEVIREIAQTLPTFSLQVRGLDCFPLKGSPKVLWVGVEESTGTLRKLVSSLENIMESLSFPKEKRGFRPHLTLGRFRLEQKRLIVPQRIKEALEKEKTNDLGKFEAREILMVKSVLSPQGPIYTKLAALGFMESP